MKTRDNYQITGSTLDDVKRSLNFLLQRMADRMDKVEGIRGTPKMEAALDMSGNRISSLADPIDDADAVSLDDVSQQIEGIAGNDIQVTGSWLFTGITRFVAPVRVYDSDGTLIHSFEGPT